MHVQHDLGRAFAIQIEEGFQDHHDEIHRCEVIVEQDHLIERWARDFRPRLFQDEAGAMFAAPVGLLGHEPRFNTERPQYSAVVMPVYFICGVR